MSFLLIIINYWQAKKDPIWRTQCPQKAIFAHPKTWSWRRTPANVTSAHTSGGWACEKPWPSSILAELYKSVCTHPSYLVHPSHVKISHIVPFWWDGAWAEVICVRYYTICKLALTVNFLTCCFTFQTPGLVRLDYQVWLAISFLIGWTTNFAPECLLHCSWLVIVLPNPEFETWNNRKKC